MSIKIDMVGFEINNIKVISFNSNKKGLNRWNCLCHCGKEFVSIGADIRRGHVKSCGCINNKYNGLSRSRLYNIHKKMKDRCYSEKNNKYKYYGGKGVKVCEEWHDFMNFYNWAIENGYSDDLTIDRIDGNGDYCPENCRWATYKEQSNNLSSNHNITYNGETHNIAQWAELLGISRQTLNKRILKGWDLERAFTPPVKKQ